MRTSLTLQRLFVATFLALAGVSSVAAQTTDSPKTPPAKPTTAGGQGASASGPELPSQVCPECLVHLRAALALRDEWRTIQKQKSDLYQKLEENRARQSAQETIINEIEAERASQEGTGGSGYDPATGYTTEVTTDAKGVAHVRTTDRNGKVVDEHTEQRGDTARLDKELATANARLNAMKQETAGFEASLRSLSAKEKVVSERLSDAVVQLAKCLEERCKHLIGKTLNDVATAFGLDPNGNGRDVPKPPTAAGEGPDVSISIGVDPPEQVCPECLLQLRVVLSLRAQLRSIQKQKADLAQKVAENEAEQKKAQNRINYLNSRLGALEGTGGSGKDPATGLTTESYYGADGKVHITVRETATGKVVEERTEERDSGAKIRQDLAKANADLAALQKAADGLKAQRERLDAREKTVSDQLSNEVAELGKCIEEHCKHLYGQTLNDVATAFGLDPNGNGRDVPKPPRTTTTVRIVTVINEGQGRGGQRSSFRTSSSPACARCWTTRSSSPRRACRRGPAFSSSYRAG